jgi:chemotaxis-related protein WspB
MLFLLFELGADRYVVDARQVVEVLPLLAVKAIPHAPPAVAGVFDCRGTPVPLIDLTQLTLGHSAVRRLSTRIILIAYPLGDGSTRLLGLLAERATRTLRREAADFVISGVTSEGTPYLGPVAADPQGLLQWIDVTTLLGPAIRDVLFKPLQEGLWDSPTSKAC